MIDLHTHILPGIDDGSSDMETSIEMVFMAYKSGVKHICTTPHCCPDLYDNYATEDLEALWEQVAARVKTERIPVHLYKGMEIMASDHITDDLHKKRVWTINKTDYFLIEFEFNENPDWCSEILRECCRNGFMPVVAHPERYFFIQRNPEIAYEWYKAGYGIQVNKGSVLSRFGRREQITAESLLRHRIVSCIASDGHNTSTRSTSMTKLRQYLEKNYGEEYMNLLLKENPGRILEGRRLVGYEPLQYNKHSGRRNG